MAERPLLWLYRGDLVRVIDGDTADIRVTRDIDFGFRMQHQMSAVMRFRLEGIDTPEASGATRMMGVAARVELGDLLYPGPFQLESRGEPDKYGGRWDARIVVFGRTMDGARTVQAGMGIDVCEYLLRHGFAQRYTGAGPRPVWDPAARYPLEVPA